MTKSPLLPLFAGRFLRSVTQGYLGIVVPLYLLALGYSPSAIGLLVAVGAGASAVLTLAVGTLADRVGRKPVLMAFGVLTAVAGVAFALRSDFAVLVVAGALGTLGQGGGAVGGGAFGPYFSAEQALTAELAGDANRTAVFIRLSLVGTLGGIFGAGIAATPHLLTRLGWSGAAAFVPLFWLTAVTGILLALVVVPLPEPSARRTRAQRPAALSRRSWSLVARFMLTNATNGLAIGFLGPIMVLWFHVRYGVNAGQIAALYALTNAVSIISYLGVSRVVRALGGAVRAVVGIRVLTCLVLAVIPLAPTFPIAGALYLGRLVLMILTVPVRQSYVMGIVPPAERSRVAAFSNVPSRVAQMAGPALSGTLIEHAWINVPLELAALFQLANAALYWTFFHGVVPPEEVAPAAGSPSAQA